MKYSLLSAMTVGLICVAVLSAQTGVPSTAPKEDPPLANSVTQQPNQTHPVAGDLGGIDVLSDTSGVDVGSYLQGVAKTVKHSWYQLSPASARAPKMERGAVTIEFVIRKNGKPAGMKLVEPSGDVRLDKAAWQSISDSIFPALPIPYSGQSLALRFHFLYNPTVKSDFILQYRE